MAAQFFASLLFALASGGVIEGDDENATLLQSRSRRDIIGISEEVNEVPACLDNWWDCVKDIAEAAWDGTKDTAEAAWDGTKDTAVSAYHNSKEFTEGVSKKVVDKTEEAVQKTKKLAVAAYKQGRKATDYISKEQLSKFDSLGNLLTKGEPDYIKKARGKIRELLHEHQKVKIHVGSVQVELDGGVNLEPQFQFGAEGEHFELKGGFGDFREAAHFGIGAKGKVSFSVVGHSLKDLLEDASVKGIPLSFKDKDETDDGNAFHDGILSHIFEKTKFDIKFNYMTGVVTASHGPGLGVAAVAGWANKDGFEMYGGMVDIANVANFDVRFGLDKPRKRLRFIAGTGPVLLDVIVFLDLSYKDPLPDQVNVVTAQLQESAEATHSSDSVNVVANSSLLQGSAEANHSSDSRWSILKKHFDWVNFHEPGRRPTTCMVHSDGEVQPCRFPFQYGGKTYDACTRQNNHEQPWCSLDWDYSGNWGYCEPSNDGCCVSESTGESCSFPFEYRGVMYHGCTKVNGHDKGWCSLDPVYKGRWGYCDCQCKEVQNAGCCVTTDGNAPEDSPCKFPFNYRGKTYHYCTEENNDGVPWCYNHQGQWGNCLCR